jgi:chemotaxis protein methyltransferase CheR
LLIDEFLKSALPPLGYNWRKHRRKGLRHRIFARMTMLGLGDLSAYLELLGRDPGELDAFKNLLTVTISRFYRDAAVFERIRGSILPAALERHGSVAIWSAGAASGEEPYTLAILASEYFPDSDIRIIATDIDQECIRRAGAGIYQESSLKKLPRDLKEKYFEKIGGGYLIREDIRTRVEYFHHNILGAPLLTGIDIILCRNLAYTYFDCKKQFEVTVKLHDALTPGGYLVLGRTEVLPPGTENLFTTIYPEEKIYYKHGD